MGRRRSLLAVSLTLAAAVVWGATSSSQDESEPADPLLWIRGPAVNLLRSVEILDEPDPDPLLPSEVSGGGVWYGPGNKRTWDGIVHLRREPVYSGWSEREGTRVTIEQEVSEDVHGVRIAVGLGEDPAFGEPGVQIGKSEVPGYALWRAHAFVPEATPHWHVLALCDDGRWYTILHRDVTRPAHLAPPITSTPPRNRRR